MDNTNSETKKKKAILIVLDGLDYSYIRNNLQNFQLFKTLYEDGFLYPLESVIPADSIPSWITIYTGLNPAEHGVIESIDYLNFKHKTKGDYSVIKGKSIWDRLDKKEKKVLIFNPFMAYPSWDVNGLMISGPVFEGGDTSTNRPDLVDLKTLPKLGGLVDHPTDKIMNKFFEDNMELTQNQFNSFHQYLNGDEYDFAFLGILTSDRMQHFLWKYTDKEDRCFKESNNLKDSILKAYQLMENNVKKILEDYGDEYNVVVISDHGHGRRCQKTFYINQWLIRNGFMPQVNKKKRAVEYFKHLTLLIFEKMHCVEAGTKFLKNFRFAHKVKNADYVFKAKGKVYAPKFDGTNPFGGINVYREAFSSDIEYENMRQNIIDGLMKVQDHGKFIMLWAKRREDIYPGSKAENYPEIVYCMDADYGVDRGLFGKRLFGSNSFHEIISGGHLPEGVILGNVEGLKKVRSVTNIHEFIMNLF